MKALIIYIISWYNFSFSLLVGIMLLPISLVIFLNALLTSAIPIQDEVAIGLSSDIPQATEELPIIKLPYGTWKASKYDKANDVNSSSEQSELSAYTLQIYQFTNIRFAAPPVGELRFAKPSPPALNTTLQTGNYGGSCMQSIAPSFLQGVLDNIAGSGAFSSMIAPLAASITGGIDLARFMNSNPSSEDCLFLDVFVPGVYSTIFPYNRADAYSDFVSQEKLLRKK
jgi:hypothetical protein